MIDLTYLESWTSEQLRKEAQTLQYAHVEQVGEFDHLILEKIAEILFWREGELI